MGAPCKGARAANRPSAAQGRRKTICLDARGQRSAGWRDLQVVEVHVGERHRGREVEPEAGERARVPPGDVGQAVDVAPVVVVSDEELDGDLQLQCRRPASSRETPKLPKHGQRAALHVVYNICVTIYALRMDQTGELREPDQEVRVDDGVGVERRERVAGVVAHPEGELHGHHVRGVDEEGTARQHHACRCGATRGGAQRSGRGHE
jgi:hypothetical protein